MKDSNRMPLGLFVLGAVASLVTYIILGERMEVDSPMATLPHEGKQDAARIQAPNVPQNEVGRAAVAPIGHDANKARDRVEEPVRITQRIAKLEHLAQEANQPIRFFGKLLDQDNNPTPDIKILATVHRWLLTPESAMARTSVSNICFTDRIGNFEISDVTGESLTLQIVAPGFEPDPSAILGYGFGPGVSIVHSPSPDKPVIFRMWKKGSGVDLICHEQKIKLSANGTPKYFDWKTGDVSDEFSGVGSVLAILVNREPQFFDYQRSPIRRWKYELTCVGQDQLKPTDDPFLYRADGGPYKGKIEHVYESGSERFSMRDSMKYYFRDDQGHYGNAMIEIYADRIGEHALVIIRSCYNPAGGPNLQPVAR